jgi:hypothetical protein
MGTVEQRYIAATEYVHRAIRQVEAGALHTWGSILPAIFATEIYAGQLKTEPVKNELARVEDRWLRAANDIERARVARDAELLADRTEENLPGAPTDWTRTNLTKEEAPRSTAQTSYIEEADHQAGAVWQRTKDVATRATREASSLIDMVLLGSGLFIGWRLLDFAKAREVRKSIEASRAHREKRRARLDAERQDAERSPS